MRTIVRAVALIVPFALLLGCSNSPPPPKPASPDAKPPATAKEKVKSSTRTITD